VSFARYPREEFAERVLIPLALDLGVFEMLFTTINDIN
jgi:hypothetical protein